MSLSTGHCAIKRISLSKTSWFYSHWINIYPTVCLRQVRSPNISRLTNKPRWGNQIMCCSFFFAWFLWNHANNFFFVSQFRFVLWLYYFVTFGFWELLLWLQHSSFETVRKISKRINDYLLYCSNRFSFSLLVFFVVVSSTVCRTQSSSGRILLQSCGTSQCYLSFVREALHRLCHRTRGVSAPSRLQ